MEFDCTKPLGDHLKEYMKPDLPKICCELELHGIVYENQFPTLWSMVCKLNATELVHLFTVETKHQIWYEYDKATCNFVFYDEDVYDADETIRLSETYQARKIK